MLPRSVSLWLLAVSTLLGADFEDPNADRDALPRVPDGFEVTFFAREPLVRQPCSMAFDAQGRLCVGMGPQYRNPKPDTPGDSVVLVLDTDGDGRADQTRTFATGFNAIQGLAWRGRDLWVANAPDLTVVRDLDGDDEADEYIRVYTDLGNLEHGLHGLNWAPDGRLYMSKGNSKGLTQPGRVAPKPFRELWGVTAPAGTPDFPAPETFRRGEYRKKYHDPEDDWGREGGVLRCDADGRNLEIVARGFRNPWDIAFDSGFHWLGTDNDQTSGDRVFMPFFGAHFGWNHPWSSHWSTEPHPPTAPVSGPLFEGSGTGVVFGDSPQFPTSHRGVWFINDWLRKTTFVWRPRWDGPLLRPAGGDWEPFVQGGPALFRPTDLEIGPDGALWILGWSSGYGAEYRDGQMTSEGRVFRVTARGQSGRAPVSAKRARPFERWTVPELLEDFDGPLPVWRINAQEELVRRGPSVIPALQAAMESGRTPEARETWTLWTLGRIALEDRSLDRWFSDLAAGPTTSLNARIQTVRILAYRMRAAPGIRITPEPVLAALQSPESRLRFEGVQALAQIGASNAVPLLLDRIAAESDPTTTYALWQSLRRLSDAPTVKVMLTDARPSVRRAALLALLEDHALPESQVSPLANDPDVGVQEVARRWLSKAAAGGEMALVRGRPLQTASPATPSKHARFTLVRRLETRGTSPCQVASTGLQPGAKSYTDRGYELKVVPEPLRGLQFIQTPNNDDGSAGAGWLTFDALMPMRVWVALDARNSPAPAWIRDGFQRDSQTIEADHWTFHLYSREFPSGRVELGGNTDHGQPGGKGNYLVILEPLPMKPVATPTAVDTALGHIGRGDPDRGVLLFHAATGAGCSHCHQLDDHGNGFGPDLASLGERATVRHIVQSILEPNAVITEGYQRHDIETDDGEISGILIEESGLSLTLGLATGETRVIPKSRIRSRQTASGSAMPAYDTLLGPDQIADLVAYLSRRTANPPAATSASPTRIPSIANTVQQATAGFGVTSMDDRVVITHSGRPVAEFIYRDSKILRPYLANVFTPGGIKATRNHPPIPEIDAVDHDTMHPGLWLGFGDVSGTDFWRNRGRMEHQRFLEPPRVGDGQVRFATECRLQTEEDRPIGTITHRIIIAAHPTAWLVSWRADVHAGADGDLVFGDQEEMGFGARVNTAITERNGGRLLNSAGLVTAARTWGQAAEWSDYTGTVKDQTIGILLMSDPSNFRPSWWHNRDYGVFVANPFGQEALTRGPKSRVTVASGNSFRIGFGAAIHDGEPADLILPLQELLRPSSQE